MGEKMEGGIFYILGDKGYAKVGPICEVETTDISENDDGYYADLGVLDEISFNCNIKYIDNNLMALLLVFKNYNCYSRYIRRAKRWKEKRRRMALKNKH